MTGNFIRNWRGRHMLRACLASFAVICAANHGQPAFAPRNAGARCGATLAVGYEAGRSGSSTSKQAPSPGALCTVRLPPWASANWRLM